MERTKSELHTHLRGMLTSREFLKMISSYVDYIYWPLDKPIDNNTKMVLVTDLLNDEKALNQLKVTHGDSVPYDNLEYLYITRTSVLSYIQAMLYINNGKKPCKVKELLKNREVLSLIRDYYKDDYSDEGILIAIMNYYQKTKTYNKELDDEITGQINSDYLNRALQELINMGCEYVEISVSSERVISLMQIKPEIANKIKCRFLLSTDRHRRVEEMKQSVKSLRKAIDKGMTVGFDIMGAELPLTDGETTYSTSKDAFSLKRKLELLVELLKDKSKGLNTLRIHSGETPDSYENTLWILKTLLDIKQAYLDRNPKEEVLPPPELRIGHGIYYEKDNESYFLALKALKAIIEINASSNKALSNIEDYSEIPYDDYLLHGIPIVLSTDGHGLYDTTLEEEDHIASENSKYYQFITRIEEKIIDRKKKR